MEDLTIVSGNASGETHAAAAARPSLLADHLREMIDHFTNFRNTVDVPRRQNLLNALRQIQAEAAAVRVPLDSSVAEIAKAIKALPSASVLFESVGVREIPGPGPYEAFDHQWAESLLNYYHTGSNRDPFPEPRAGSNPVKTLIETNEIKIAIAGDMGADARVTPPVEIAHLIEGKQPQYTIHLGDVYYSGSGDEEAKNFLNFWPGGSEASYTLNSNHEMYSGGRGYFRTLLKDQRFKAQEGLSYFALTNPHWLIIGLDSAYFAYYRSLLYEEGSLYEDDTRKQENGLVQFKWLKDVLAEHSGKRVILLTHHDGFDINPATRKVSQKPLMDQVSKAMTGVRDWWWYFGHVHAPLVYARIFKDGSSYSARCAGHGAVPYEPFPQHFQSFGDGTVRIEWTETDLARNGGDPRRAPNGFALLTLKGAEIKEEFYDELGRQRWSNF